MQPNQLEPSAPGMMKPLDLEGESTYRGKLNASERAKENNQENCFHFKCVRLLGPALTDDA